MEDFQKTHILLMYNSSVMKILKTFISLFFILMVVFVPLRADALVPPLLPFGGWPVIPPIPCICSATIWTWFAPLYLIGSVPLTGPLVYVPYATLPLANFLITIPLTPHLGAYIPGIQACWQYIGFACIPIPAIGMMAYVGTGLPGGK